MRDQRDEVIHLGTIVQCNYNKDAGLAKDANKSCDPDCSRGRFAGDRGELMARET